MKELGDILLGLGILINAIMSLLNFLESKKAAKNILVLEQNTNSIKDALVKVTGESEHAKGVIAGRKEQKAESGTKLR